ncbi:hypothetical protein DPMN_173497 [Dreissena polymorpha]|uniref:Uncharacterized protein n=1 Tax=Dreissena polymorpha TaxID=45954 RepID=A0A9D4IFJ8_DREPO|nr:hypothetical protein DPMN_173497 [Dreissena polymorpha]
MNEPSGKIARWLETLAQYDSAIKYRPEKKQGHCDALSRCVTPYDCYCAEVNMRKSHKGRPFNKRKSEMMS